MAFSRSNFSKWSSGESIINNLFAYSSSADSVATIKGSGYFNDVTDVIRQNDVIFVVGSDDKVMLEVTSATGASTVTTIEYSGTSASVSLAEGNVLVGNASGIAAALNAKTSGQILVGNGTTVTSVAVSGDATLSSGGALTIAANAVELGMLASGIAPSHVVKYAGTHSYGGGGTSDAVTVSGVLATDIVMAVIKASTNSVSVNKATPTTDTVTFTFSGDPGASTEVFYTVLRAAA